MSYVGLVLFLGGALAIDCSPWAAVPILAGIVILECEAKKEGMWH